MCPEHRLLVQAHFTHSLTAYPQQLIREDALVQTTLVWHFLISMCCSLRGVTTMRSAEMDLKRLS